LQPGSTPSSSGTGSFPDDELLGLRCEPVVGGRFCFAVRRDSHVLHHAGRYLRIEPARGLSFTWDVTGHPAAAASVIDVMLRPSTPGCFVTVTHYPNPGFAPAEVTRHEADLHRMLDSLAEHLRRADA